MDLGGNWRMPTKEECQELIDNCFWTLTTLNGIKGYKVQSKIPGYTANWIFLPVANYRNGTSLFTAACCGLYWSSSLFTDFPNTARYLGFDSDNVHTGYYGRSDGHPVRPVSE